MGAWRAARPRPRPALSRDRTSEGRRQKQAEPLNRGSSERMLEVKTPGRLHRRVTEAKREVPLIALRTAALVAVAYDTLLRRSELVPLYRGSAQGRGRLRHRAGAALKSRPGRGGGNQVPRTRHHGAHRGLARHCTTGEWAAVPAADEGRAGRAGRARGRGGGAGVSRSGHGGWAQAGASALWALDPSRGDAGHVRGRVRTPGSDAGGLLENASHARPLRRTLARPEGCRTETSDDAKSRLYHAFPS
ncbi:hypothetical protein MCBMB27_05690 (plasmid) [Methylobacterium phyllosphaerae]|uniref:Tyr recombinase domain-containing protein n=1 Tax=Methylobacterium phyllosphaerae TaxID=418223 RepID=A0AAE8HXP5_9HYPH|nr:hypothetical protein MCBMB27_05690 [Methylobacterium phyllosphaerae]SFH65652.1 hypothetical protein SAMN05192567_14019 [Methylobacterium phyllosphaerae]